MVKSKSYEICNLEDVPEFSKFEKPKRHTVRVPKGNEIVINSFVEGDEQRMMLMGLKRFTKYEGVNIKAARQQVAQRLIEEGKFVY